MNDTQTVIMVAEDDEAIRQGLVDALDSEGYSVVEASDGERALRMMDQETIHLVILDVMMPKMSGYDVCRALRKQENNIPVLMLTAKGEEIDKVLGLELGADDYMTKPFGVRELLARVHALLRRTSPTEARTNPKSHFNFGPFLVDPKTFELKYGEESTAITARELTILKLFHARPHEVLSRDELLNGAWGLEYYGTTRTLDQHIAQLRKKISCETLSGSDLIVTVHGIGYRYSPSEER